MRGMQSLDTSDQHSSEESKGMNTSGLLIGVFVVEDQMIRHQKTCCSWCCVPFLSCRKDRQFKKAIKEIRTALRKESCEL